MVVSHKSSYELPIGCFSISGFGSNERSNLVLQALEKLHSVGIKVISLTFDGAATNLGMEKILGCSMKPNNLKSYFYHSCTNEQVCIFLDPCHMFKLIRNALGDLGTYMDGRGNLRQFVKRLNQVQESEGLQLGNKLERRPHWLRGEKK